MPGIIGGGQEIGPAHSRPIHATESLLESGREGARADARSSSRAGVSGRPAEMLARAYTVPRPRTDPWRVLARDARAHVRRIAIEELARSFMSEPIELRSVRLAVARWARCGRPVASASARRSLRRRRSAGASCSSTDRASTASRSTSWPSSAGSSPSTSRHLHGSQGSGRGADGASRPARTPSLGETLARVLLLGRTNTSDAARRHADLVMRPRADGVGTLESDQIDAAREAGRAAAREAPEAAPDALWSATGR
jgi:hypothetical protein